MQAKVLDVPPVVTGQERADEWADQLEDLLLEVGRIFPRADLRCRAAACVRGLLGPLVEGLDDDGAGLGPGGAGCW